MRALSLIIIYMLCMIFLISVHSYANELIFEMNRIDKSTYLGRLYNNSNKYYEHILIKVDFYYYKDISKIAHSKTFEFKNVYPKNEFRTKVVNILRNKWRWYRYEIYYVKHVKEREGNRK